jgi:DNA-directed RNA polymerase specialized sigma24 family protein
LIDRIRQHQKARQREEPLSEADEQLGLPSPQPCPNEVAQAADLWERILAHCPPEHRPILGLRRQGYSLAEIGERTGLHPDSIRRILRTLARQLAFEDQESGVRSQGSEARAAGGRGGK